MKLRSGIYKWTNIKTGEIYIGQAENILKRKKRHLNLVKMYMRKKKRKEGIQTKKLLYLSFLEHGYKAFRFEIIEYCSLEDLNEREEYWIKEYSKEHKMFNMLAGFRTDKKYKEK